MVIKGVVRAATAKHLTRQWVTDVSIGTSRAVLRRYGQANTIVFSGVLAGSALTGVPAPVTGPDGTALTILKLILPRIPPP